MFKFFYTKVWLGWSIGVTSLILLSTWYQVSLDVKINEWFGEFYDKLQQALTVPGSVSLEEFMGYMYEFGTIAGIWVVIAVVTGYVTSHWIFRWRTATTDHYHKLYQRAASSIEGASQRVQEDTLKFARIMETLGVGLMDAVFTLFAFVPILWVLSKQVDVLPWIGPVPHALVWVAMLSALGGTALLACVGFYLPKIEYDIQKEEAGYRKELVMGEEDAVRGGPIPLKELFSHVRKIHYKSYFHYTYFNLVKWSYFQGMVLVPYVALAPTIVSGAITLGFVQQITRAFGRVESSLQYLIRSWSTIIELMSVYRRLAEWEGNLKNV